MFPDPQFRLKIVDGFYYRAHEMRSKIVEFFSEPHRATREKNFKINLWWVENCYYYFRVHTDDILGKELSDDFHSYLSLYARTNLGMNTVSGSFVSIYTAGCFQTAHSDQLNGTYGWTLGLSDWSNRTFTGGSFQIAKDGAFDPNLPRDHRGQSNYWEDVPCHFNQLTLFDDRYAHQVPVVSGQYNPLHGRIVCHGHIY